MPVFHSASSVESYTLGYVCTDRGCAFGVEPGNFVRRCPILAAVSQSSPIVAKCSRCGKTHPGECHWEMPRTCFKCDLVDHYARNCEQVTIRLQGSQAGNF
jgi:hypothetical protein